MKRSDMKYRKDGFDTIQDQAYDLLGRMLLEEQVLEIQDEIEAERGTEKEQEMLDFFAMHESEYMQIIEKNFRMSRNSMRKALRILPKIGQIAAIVIFCAVLAGSVAIATSSTVRAYIMKMLTEVMPEYTEINLEIKESVDVPTDWNGMYYLTVLPEGATMIECRGDETYAKVFYALPGNENGWDLCYSEYSPSFGTRIDTENAEITNMVINGYETTIAVKKGLVTAYWTDGQRTMVLQTQTSTKEEMVAYVSGVKLIK